MKNLLSLGVSAFLFMACSDTGSVFEVPLPGSLDSEEPVSSSSIVKKSSASKSKEDSESNKGEDKSEYDPKTGTLKDLRDGQIYKTVVFGEGENAQIWMAENLNYAYRVPTAKIDSSSFCYDNNLTNCEKYGRLYLWSAAMDSAAVFSDAGKGCGDDTTCKSAQIVRGICPKGWHLPDSLEWHIFIETIEGNEYSNTKKIKSTSGWISSDSGDANGTDEYGFSALPAGFLYNLYDEFKDLGKIAYFWANGEHNYAGKAVHLYNYGQIGIFTDYKDRGYSIRCLMD